MKKNLYLLLSFLSFMLIFSCVNDPKAEAENLAKQWCSCNKELVPLHQKLKDAESPQQRKDALDKMHSLVAQNMQCLGGEKKWVEKDQQMTDAQKDQFLKTFRRVKEEQCPELFQVIAALEDAIKK